MDLRVTDALDVRFDPVYFCKTQDGIAVIKDRMCRFYAIVAQRTAAEFWSDTELTLEIDRDKKMTRIKDFLYAPGNLHYLQVGLRKGDVLNFYADPGVAVYETIVQISWLYSAKQTA